MCSKCISRKYWFPKWALKTRTEAVKWPREEEKAEYNIRKVERTLCC